MKPQPVLALIDQWFDTIRLFTSYGECIYTLHAHAYMFVKKSNCTFSLHMKPGATTEINTWFKSMKVT